MLEMVPSCGSQVRLRLPHDLGPFCDPLVMYRVWKAVKGPAKSSPSEALSPEGKVRRGSSEGSWFGWLAASLGQRFCFLLLINKHCRGAWGVTPAGKTPGRSGVRAISPAKRGSVPVTRVPLISLFFPGIRKQMNFREKGTSRSSGPLEVESNLESIPGGLISCLTLKTQVMWEP